MYMMLENTCLINAFKMRYNFIDEKYFYNMLCNYT